MFHVHDVIVVNGVIKQYRVIMLLWLLILVDDLVLCSLYLFFSVNPQLFCPNCQKVDDNDDGGDGPQYSYRTRNESKTVLSFMNQSIFENAPTDLPIIFNMHCNISVATGIDNS